MGQARRSSAVVLFVILSLVLAAGPAFPSGDPPFERRVRGDFLEAGWPLPDRSEWAEESRENGIRWSISDDAEMGPFLDDLTRVTYRLADGRECREMITRGGRTVFLSLEEETGYLVFADYDQTGRLQYRRHLDQEGSPIP